MAVIDTPSIVAPAKAGRIRRLSGFRAFWGHFFATAFSPYRPELHYMRGPGPAWRARHGMDAPFRLQRRDG